MSGLAGIPKELFHKNLADLRSSGAQFFEPHGSTKTTTLRVVTLSHSLPCRLRLELFYQKFHKNNHLLGGYAHSLAPSQDTLLGLCIRSQAVIISSLHSDFFLSFADEKKRAHGDPKELFHQKFHKNNHPLGGYAHSFASLQASPGTFSQKVPQKQSPSGWLCSLIRSFAGYPARSLYSFALETYSSQLTLILCQLC